MSARILVVDDVEINVKLLGAKLASEYFDVLTASNGPDCDIAGQLQRASHHLGAVARSNALLLCVA